MAFHVNLKTDLEANEVLDRLNAVTEKFHSDSNSRCKFEGKITSSEFRIYPTFDYGPRNQLRPEINGKIEQYENYCLIRLKFGLADHLKLPLFLIVFINIGFTVFLFVKPIDEVITWKVFALFIPLTFGMFYLTFKQKTDSSTKILMQLFEAEIIK